MSSNKHQRLHQLEKLANEKRVKAKTLAAKIESDRGSKEVASLSTEELKVRYDKAMEDIRNAPPNPELEGLTTQEMISKYMQACKEN